MSRLSSGPVWAVVVAAGGGTRFGGAKQFTRIGGRRVLDWSVAVAAAACDGVVVVLPPERLELVRGATRVVVGGASRSASVRRGLAAVPDDVEVVLIHDAARPAASGDLFRAVISAVRAGADGVVPAVPVTDSLRWRDGGAVDRDALVAVQTPQGFRAEVLRAAHAAEPEASDDATLVEAAGGTIVVVDGETTNRKLTHPDDLAPLAAALGASAEDGS